MAYTTINKSTDHFNTVTYSNAGDGAKAVTGVGFQPDLVWLKNRTVAYNAQFHDAVRGASNGSLYTNTTAAVDTGYPISSFDSDGFTTGSQSSNASQNSASQVAWNLKANGAGSSNSDGSQSSTVSVNTAAGFSIVKYTGYGAATYGHGLGTTPQMIIIKKLNSSDDWFVYHHKLLTPSATQKQFILLNSNAAFASNGSATTFTSVSNSIFGVGTDDKISESGDSFIAYCFAEKTGYSKFGSYTGNGSSSSPTFIYTGFKPKFVMVKVTNVADSWFIHDNKRDGYNDDNEYLFADLNNAEGTNTNRIRLLSNGFSVPTTDKSHNVNGNSYIYMAFGQTLVGSNNIPCTAR
jgi:hypothetical protein